MNLKVHNNFKGVTVHKSGPRLPGISTCKFDKDVDLQEADSFIRRWIAYAIVLANERAKRLNIQDRDVVKSSALEGSFNAFVVMSEKYANEIYTDKLEKNVLKKCVKQCLFHQLIVFGFIPDKKRVWFPKEWISWEEYFKNEGIRSVFYNFDLNELIKNECFTETEIIIINYFIKGYDPVEIAKVLGYGSRHVHMTLQRLKDRFLNCSEVDFKVKRKYGRVGPYKKKKG